MVVTDQKIDYLVVDTTAFIENAPLQVRIFYSVIMFIKKLQFVEYSS